VPPGVEQVGETVSGNLKHRGSNFSMRLAMVAVLAMLLSAGAPALADHRPKHVKGAEEPAEAVDPALASEIEDSSAAVDPATTDPAREKVDGSTDQANDARTKVDKEKATKPKNAAAAGADPTGSKGGCGNDQCHKSTAGEAQATSVGLVSDAAGGAAVVLPQESSAPRAGEGGRTGLDRWLQARSAEVGGSTGGRRSVLNGADVLAAAAAQPSLAIVVDALNDADGDGIYSDSETAPASGADVSFKAIITNMGATAFEIATVSQSFLQQGGRVQVEVCADLDGLTLGFGESLACSFSVSAYSPAMGETVVNTVTASALEIAGSKRRGTSDSDNTRVATFLEDQVLAVAIERAPGPLAFTGTGAARLLALALVLLAAGASALYLSGVREKTPMRPVLSLGPWLQVSRLTPFGFIRTRPPEKIARR
jgi:hypothetical protein